MKKQNGERPRRLAHAQEDPPGVPAQEEGGQKEAHTLLKALTLEQVERELNLVQSRHTFRQIARNTVFFLAVVAAAVVLLVVFLFPVVQVDGTSMTPTLRNGDLTIAMNGAELTRGDIISFYRNNTLYIKRIVAMGGDVVDIDEKGVVYVNGQALEEPYVAEKARGSCDIAFPYEVPIDQYFVLGDHRSASTDSRHAAVGCIGADMVQGRLLFRFWPLDRFGPLQGGDHSGGAADEAVSRPDERISELP